MRRYMPIWHAHVGAILSQRTVLVYTYTRTHTVDANKKPTFTATLHH